jgi:alkylhydroperoxidase family enzyme
MSDRHAEAFERLRASALEEPGKLDPAARKAIADERAVGAIPPVLLPYLEKVAYQAHTVTDEDVEALKKAGLSEDKIFEATVAAAVGAGLKRLRMGLAVLADVKPEKE